jgi:ferric-dicitrate binding protein FerR (iron transport regulator)
MLKDNYGLKVIVRDTSLLSQTVSGSMPLGDDDILIRQLAKAFQLKITRENNSILIEEP